MSEILFHPDTDCMNESAPQAQPDPGPLPPPRLRRPDRQQMTMRPSSLDELLPIDHDARTVCAVVCSWDLSRFLATIKARGEEAGRAATDPRLLIALWLYAAIRGVAMLASWIDSAARATHIAGSAAECRSTTTHSAILGSDMKPPWTTF